MKTTRFLVTDLTAALAATCTPSGGTGIQGWVHTIQIGPLAELSRSFWMGRRLVLPW